MTDKSTPDLCQELFGPMDHRPDFSFFRFMNPSDMPQVTFRGDYNGSFTYLGPHIQTLAQHASEFCTTVAGVSGNVAPVISAFLDHVQTEYLDPATTSQFFSLRVSKPSTVFDQPHWHIDGLWFTPPTLPPCESCLKHVSVEDIPPHPPPPLYKYGAVISGPATMFLRGIKGKAHETMRERMKHNILCQMSRIAAPPDRHIMARYPTSQGMSEEEWQSSYWHESRKVLSDYYREVPVLSPSPGEGARYVVGQYERGTIHSEPPLTASRLIITVVPGTEAQIREMCDLWGQEYGKVDTTRQGEDIAVEYPRLSATYPIGW